jgi:hypothetical protein
MKEDVQASPRRHFALLKKPLELLQLVCAMHQRTGSASSKSERVVNVFLNSLLVRLAHKLPGSTSQAHVQAICQTLQLMDVRLDYHRLLLALQPQLGKQTRDYSLLTIHHSCQ